MTETYPKSRLKRKKPSVEEPQPEVAKAAGKKSRGPGDCAAAWWNTEQLCGAEALWALTLKSALPYLDQQRWDPLPDLPLPVTQESAWRHSREQGWCDLSEEVAALPAPPRQARQEDALGLVSSSRRSEPAATDGEAAPPAPPSGSRRPSPCVDQGRPSSAGPPRRELEEEEREAPRPSSNQAEKAEDRVPLQQVERGGGGGSAELKSCPMCLLEFPAGFTQMECDGHLALCLSEMNADMTW